MNWLCKRIGHKFIKRVGGVAYARKTCYRCGLHPTCPVCGHQA